MRFYDIALYMIIFNLVLSFMYTSVGSYIDGKVDGVEYLGDDAIFDAEQKITSRINEVYTPIFSELNWLVENVRLAIQGVATFITWLGKSTILFPVLWYEIGAQYIEGPVFSAFVTLLSLPFYFVYVMGIIQWSAGRSAKEAQ